MKKQVLLFICILIITLFTVACNTNNVNSQVLNLGGQQSAKINQKDCAFEKISPAKSIQKIFEDSGDSPRTNIISIKSETKIRIYWNQLSTGDFLLSIINNGSNLANDPAKNIIVEAIVGPSSGCADVTLNTGEYELSIENSDNNWSVLINEINYIN